MDVEMDSRDLMFLVVGVVVAICTAIAVAYVVNNNNDRAVRLACARSHGSWENTGTTSDYKGGCVHR